MTPRTRLALLLAALLATACDRIGIGVDNKDEHGMTALMYAARQGDSAEVETLVARGANVNAVVPRRDLKELVAFMSWMQQLPSSDIGYTPLHYAVAGKHRDVARQLLGHGADANLAARGGEVPMDLAVFQSDTETMAVLKAGGATLSARQLWTAVGHSSPAAVALLLEWGAQPNQPPPRFTETQPPAPPIIVMGAGRGDTAVLGLLIRAGADINAVDANGWTALRHARRANRQFGGGRRGLDMTPAIAMLQFAGANDVAGERAESLMVAIWSKDAAAAKRAITAGANPNGKDERGIGPLNYAARQGLAEIVSALIAARADVNASPQNGETPLIGAVENGSAEVVSLLLKAGADPNLRDKIKRTPIQVAGGWRRVEVMGLLLAAGATIDSTALPYASLGGPPELVKMLLAAGANPNAARGHALSEATRGCARNDNTGVILALLEGGADPKIHGEYAHLHRAAALCDTSIVRIFLERGADPNHRDGSGNTPLVSAVSSGRLDAVRMLIAAKADVNSRNDEGKTVLSFAVRYPEIQAELRRAGAQ